MPHLRELAGQQRDLGFNLIAISVDGTRLDQFKKHEPKGVPFTVLLDNGKKVSESYGIRHVPTVINLDAEGNERFRHVGFPGNHVILRDLRKVSPPP
jgi:peroxiredoxin